MSKKFIFIFIAIAVVFLAVVALVSWLVLLQPSSQKNLAGESDYSAVYLATGEVYYGKLSWFPWPHLSQVLYLQRGVNQKNESQLGIAPFTSVFWGPEDKLYLNPKEIVFWVRLRGDSQLVPFLKNPEMLTQGVLNASAR